MINQIHSWFHRPERGWEPVSKEHARWYAEGEWRNFDPRTVDYLESRLKGLEGKRVLDLGGGPGQFSIEFAKRGAQVVWHDISRNYQEIAIEKAKENGAQIEFSLGYLEDAEKFRTNPFDLVFSRICWCYSRDDAAFARLIYSLIKIGGAGYIDAMLQNTAELRGIRTLQYYLNSRLSIKIGHPHPPHGRIAALFRRFPLEQIETDYSSSLNDRIYFVKSRTVCRAC